MSLNSFEYKYALVCKSVPNSVKDGLSLKTHDGIDVEKAREEHCLYLDCMKSIGLKLIEIEGNEVYPDCVFVEDCAIVIKNKAFITNPGAISRRGEVQNVRKGLEDFASENANETILEIGSVENKDESFIDGGDCCFTGRELLCGISSRTNTKGAEELERFFHKDFPVSKINVGNNNLHLKSVLTMLDYDTILISKTKEAQLMKKEIELKSKFSKYYKFIEVDDDKAANVLFINGKVYCPTEFSDVYKNIEYLKNKQYFPLPVGEFGKIDGCLSCRSVLF